MWSDEFVAHPILSLAQQFPEGTEETPPKYQPEKSTCESIFEISNMYFD
jgi:hypothetical protein